MTKPSDAPVFDFTGYAPLNLHLLSAHCNNGALLLSPEEASHYHEHEHFGPGGIRHHDYSSRQFDPVKASEVLRERVDSDGGDFDAGIAALMPRPPAPTDESTMDAAPLTEGTVAETTQAYKNIPTGTRFTVEEFWARPVPGDGRYGDSSAWQEDVYLGSNRGGLNNIQVPARYVRAVPAENLLAESSIISDVAAALYDSDLGVIETSIEGPHIHVHASLRDLPFSFTLTVEDVDLHG